jgi:predicted flap endonuclease-1-like 5' DNA nuclease
LVHRKGNGIGRWLLGLAAGIAAVGASVYGFNHSLLVALAIGIGVAVLLWLLLGLVWGPTEPVFVMEKPRVRKIVVERTDSEPEPAPPVAVAVAPVRVAVARVPVAEVVDAAQVPVAEAPAQQSGSYWALDADLDGLPVVRPKAVVRPRLEVPPPVEAKRKPAAKAKAVATPKGSAKSKAAVTPAADPLAGAEQRPKVAAAKTPAAKPRAVKARPAGPLRLKAARKGVADDLKVIQGIGPALEKLLNGLGIYHFDQIAGWSDADVALIDAEMKTFKGRVTRDKWVIQAKVLAAGGTVAEAEAAAKA